MKWIIHRWRSLGLKLKLLFHEPKNEIGETKAEISTKRVSNTASLSECSLGENISIGDRCYLNKVAVGDFTYLSKDVTIMNTMIGKFCSIAQGVLISGGNHPSKTFVSTSPVFFSPHKQCGVTFSDNTYFREMGVTKICNDVWIGANAVIKDDVIVGDGAIIGAGAIVIKDVAPYSIVAGNPARLIRYRFEPDEIDFLLRFKWWEKDDDWLKENYKDFHDIESFKKKYG